MGCYHYTIIHINRSSFNGKLSAVRIRVDGYRFHSQNPVRFGFTQWGLLPVLHRVCHNQYTQEKYAFKKHPFDAY